MVTANETRSLSELEDSDPRRFALQPGRNCWRAGIANRATALVDGAAYFAALETAMQRAERQLFVVGWDVHAHAVGEETVQEVLHLFADSIAAARRAEGATAA